MTLHLERQAMSITLTLTRGPMGERFSSVTLSLARGVRITRSPRIPKPCRHVRRREAQVMRMMNRVIAEREAAR